jgi:DMSO/TMAO reductase YedYZ heme-binding membrane subunit
MPAHRNASAHRTASPRIRTGVPGEQGAARLAKLVLLPAVVCLAALGEVGMRSALAPGSPPGAAAHALTILRFYAGVCTLVALSLTVAAGLLATDRILLAVRQRIWVQSAHRTLSMLAVVFLGLHVLTEVAGGRISALAAVVPFAGGSLYLGLGPIAAYLMAAVAWTGLIRARFAGGGKPWAWRLLHSIAYLCWPIALLHGLRGGRPPAVWVTASYLLLVLAVAITLVVRVHADRVRRKRISQQGQRVPTRSVAVQNPSHRARGRAAVSSRFVPEDTFGDLPTLVDLDSARILRGGPSRTRRASAPLRRGEGVAGLTPAQYSVPPRRAIGGTRGDAR